MKRILVTVVTALAFTAVPAAQAHPRVMPMRAAKAAIDRWAQRIGNSIQADAYGVDGCSRVKRSIDCKVWWFLSADQTNCFASAIAHYPGRSSRIAVASDASQADCQSSGILQLG